MGLWFYVSGSMGLWVYGTMGLWVYGSMCLSVYGSMGLWFYVSMGLAFCQTMGLWVYGSLGLHWPMGLWVAIHVTGQVGPSRHREERATSLTETNTKRMNVDNCNLNPVIKHRCQHFTRNIFGIAIHVNHRGIWVYGFDSRYRCHRKRSY